jgi:membrane fusion protein, copper/silver efflux system
MNAVQQRMGAAAVLGIAAVAGVWAGQSGHVRLPLAGAPKTAAPMVAPAADGPVIYYRDPDNKGLYSDAPKLTPDGRPYIGVHASEDVSVEKAKPTMAMAPTANTKIKFYRNPMGLPDTSPTPKKDSMGMDYIPVFEGETEDGNAVKLSPGKIQRAGVETVAVSRHASTRTIKAPGVVTYDERRIWAVVPRFDGFVEQIMPVTTGQHVKKGDPLVSVFGQEILAQGSRLIIEQAPGWKGEDTLNLRTFKGESGTIIGAHRRLRNLGVPDEFIETIKRERRVPDTLIVRSPVDGIIIERNIVQGQGFKAGDVAFRIADHSVMWVNADVPEGDMAAIKTGQAVSLSTRAFPGRAFTGVVALVLPHLMKETRSARVRVELANPDLALLPDMYADVEIATGGGEAVVSVPTSAVIDSGNRRVVIVELGHGRFEPRDVKIGRRGDGMTEILTGLAEGDRVVANGNFLIDAESNLQAALKGFTPPPLAPTAAEAKP